LHSLCTIKRTILIAACIVFSHIPFAQHKPYPTRFDKFVIKPGIEWAAYASDTFDFERADLNNLLLSRLMKNEIRASLPIESRTREANDIRFVSKDSVKLVFNEIIDTSKFKLTEVTQMIYVEKGKLKCYVAWVTPAIPLFLSTGKYIGEKFYFNTCYNFKYNSIYRKKNKLTYLSRTKKKMSLDPGQGADKLKEMYGNNLLKTLWPRVLENKIAAYGFVDNRKLMPEELNVTLAYEMPAITPIYDSTSGGTVVRFDMVSGPIDSKRFTDLELVQDWYYDRKKNRVYSEIKEMILYLRKSNKTTVKDPEPVLKLVFN
jgi:Gliding motility associated protein GldN